MRVNLYMICKNTDLDLTKDRPVLTLQGAPHDEKAKNAKARQKKKPGHDPNTGLGTEIYRLTLRQL